MLSTAQRFVRDVGFSFTSLAVMALVGFILRIFLARYLGAGDLGLYTLTYSVYSIGILLSAFGIGQALTKYAAEFREDTPRTNLLVSSGVITVPALGCAVGLIIYVSSSPIASLFDMPELAGLLRILAFTLPFVALQLVVLGFLNGLRRMRLFAFINIARSALTIILTVALVLLGYGLVGAMVALLSSTIVVSLFALFSIRKSLVRPRLGQYAPAIKMLLVFGGYLVLTGSITLIQLYTDNFMVGYFMTKTDVGYYSVAVTLFMAMHLLPRAVSMIANPTMSTYWGRGEVDKIEDLVNRIMKYTASLLIPVGFLLAFLSQPIITLIFGKDFAPAILPFQILLIRAVFGGIITSVGTALSSTTYINMLFKLSGIAAVTNIIFNLLLIPRWGINGAASATVLTSFVDILLTVYFMQRLIGIKIHLKWFAKLFSFTVVLAAATYGLGLVVSCYIGVPIAVIILILVLLKYFFTREDLTLISQLLPWRRPRNA